MELIDRKTASLFSACARLGAIAGGAAESAQERLGEFAWNLGIAFQLIDDVLDFTSREKILGKPVGNDLREHKMTIPVILALENGGSSLREALARFYEGAPGGNEPVAALIAAVGEAGGFSRTRESIMSYVERAKASLAPLGTAPARAELVALADALARDSAVRARG
jgi:octaprenyl-diphosphate synthase